jgi:hypothetical protein
MSIKMELHDYADGVRGHYCIGRRISPDSIYWEYYNKGKWCSAGEVFKNLNEALRKLTNLRRRHNRK